LRAYQLEGLNWLRYCWYNRTNSILADEMGLGKTVQSVSIINSINTEHKNRGPFLVIAPLSTIPHWEREFENWTFMNVIVYHGNSDARSLMRKHEFHYTDENNKVVQKNLFKFNTLITTFEMIITDSSILSQIKWKYVVIDEAHRLKNRNSRILTEFKHFKFDHLLLLTGTPIQNNTEELWTLLNVLDEKNFP
jgi:chromodomain-helicase-DNA-binding protein 7